MTKETTDERERAFNREVGLRIRKVREAAKVGVAELAEAVGVSRQSVYMWEKGETGVTPLNLGLVAHALCVSADDLVPVLTPSMRPRPLVRVEVRTRNPEDYELVNHADGTRWEIGDGAWKASTRDLPPDGTDEDNPIGHSPGCSWETTPYCDCGADPERVLRGDA